MKDHRGKLLRSESNYIDNGENYFGDNNYFPEFPCRKHPASSSSSSNGGICAYCLNDRLSQLVCPDCGEQRISSYGSCSCSRNFTDNNTEDVSGRISVLLENDHHHHHQKGSDQIYNSRSRMGPRSSNFDEFDNTHFQRSYSVAHTAQSRPSESSSSSSGTDMSTSSSSIPDFNTNPPNLAAMKRNRFGLSTREFGYRGENGFEHQMYNNGGGRSCRISSVGDRDLRKCRKSYKVWKWFSKHHNNQNDSDKFDDHHRDFNL